jgi:alcohol dehydrogenase
LSLSAVCPASCATATIAAALEAAGDLRGQAICITGAGLLGLTAAAMARWMGAAEVIVCEVHEHRRQLAAHFGATRCCGPTELAETVREATGGMGVDAAVEVSGSPAAFESLWSGLRMGATAVLVGSVFPSAPVPLALEQVVRRNLTLRGIHNYAAPHLIRAVDFLARASAEYDFSGLVSAWYPLQDIASAVRAAADPRAVRIGVCGPNPELSAKP